MTNVKCRRRKNGDYLFSVQLRVSGEPKDVEMSFHRKKQGEVLGDRLQ